MDHNRGDDWRLLPGIPGLSADNAERLCVDTTGCFGGYRVVASEGISAGPGTQAPPFIEQRRLF